MLKHLKKITLLAIIGFMAYGLYSPETFPFTPLQPALASAHQKLFNLEFDFQQIKSQAYSHSIKIFTKIAQNAKLPKKWLQDLPETPDEIIVEDIVQAMTQEVTQLPQKQAQKVKTAFCQDVINQATESAAKNHSGEVAGSQSSQPE